MKTKATTFKLSVFILIFGALFCAMPRPAALAYGKIIYVDRDAPGIHDGKSWTTAYTYLQYALDEAFFGDEIWVAEGTYVPTINHGGSGNRFKSFQMKNGVSIYGGFDPTVGDTAFEDRDWNTNETILSGDIGTPKFTGDNCYHVFYHSYGLALDNTAVLDGFTITYGNANGSSDHTHEGGGMYNDENSPTVANCVFSNNHASLSGGGMFNKNWAEPAVIDTLFTDNSAQDGGGMDNLNYAAPLLTGCTFDRNEAENHGGGLMIYMHSSPTVTQCIFKNNRVTAEFGKGGAVYIGWDAAPVLTNCLLYYNHAYFGGGVTTGLDPSPVLTNCTLYGNWSVQPGGAVRGEDSAPEVTNGIIWHNSPDQIYQDATSPSLVTYCDVSGGYPGTGNIATDPRFRNVPDYLSITSNPGTVDTIQVANAANYAIGDRIEINDDGILRSVTLVKPPSVQFSPALDAPSEANVIVGNWGDQLFVRTREDFHITSGSRCIEAGNNAAAGLPSVDIDGDARVIDGDNDGTPTVDMGIDEYLFQLDGVIFVDADATGTNNGSSWQDAFSDLQDALDLASSGDQIWVAEGIYRPSRRTDSADPRSAAFRMKNGVTIYGGFDPSSGDTWLEDRDWEENVTILSGDIGRIGSHDDNCYHVFNHSLLMAVLGSSAVLDGFTVSDGRAGSGNGGGMFNDGSSSPTIVNCLFRNNNARDGGAVFNGNSSNPDFTNCTFIDNSSFGNGGAMCNENSSPILTNCTFGDTGHDNTAGLTGGGVHNDTSSPEFTGCRFASNLASSGGGMANDTSSPTLIDCTFDNNRVLGGADSSRGGGMYCENSSPILRDCVFTWNRALTEAFGMGGGLYCDADSAPSLSGCQFQNNSSQRDGGAIYCDGGSPTIADSTVISDNQAENGHGGGIYCTASATPTLTDATIENNLAHYGGGIYCIDASPTITSCTITGNEGVMEAGGISIVNGSEPIITGSTISNNFTTAWGTLAGGIYCSFSSPTLEDCDITGNNSKIGAGVVITGYSSPTLTNCNISGNYAAYDAGGVFCSEYSSPTFDHCVISNNTAAEESGDGAGGGMYVFDGSSPTLRSCEFHGNQALGYGGGIVIRSESEPTLVNCSFWDNEAAGIGGGIYNFGSSPTVTNCSIWGNRAPGGGGGIYTLLAPSFSVTNSILWANTADQIHADAITANHCDIEGDYAGTNNIDADPLFMDPSAGDFHLQNGSPCIDTGNNAAPSLPDTDFEEDDRIIDGDSIPGAVVDIGADEHLPSSNGDHGDYDGDGDTDGFDLATLAAGFGSVYHEVDLEILAGYFGQLH